MLLLNAEEAEAEQFQEDLQDLPELTPKKKKKIMLFSSQGTGMKSRKSEIHGVSVNHCEQKQIWPCGTK